jgi:hypothetical protein
MQTCPRYHQRSLASEETLRAAFEFRNETAPYLIYDANYWLFGKLGTRGLIVAAYVAPAISLSKGKYVQARRDPQATGRAIESAIRKYNHSITK